MGMRKTNRSILMLVAVLVIAACNMPGCGPGAIDEPSPLRLRVEVQNANETFNTVGQEIRYNYVVTNAGTTRLQGPVIITDAQRQTSCPDVNTVGNTDAFLDPGESITCTGTYRITQNDLTAGSVINVATANAGNLNSNQSGVTVTMNVAPTSALTLAKTASPTIYTAAGQQIIYTYVITNTGTATLGPARFTISDNRLGTPLGTPFNCNETEVSLTTGATVMCTATYVITSTDMGVATITNSATASGGGAPASQPATATVTNLTLVTATPSTPASNLTPGTTIQHRVIRGEWLLQIARCYGAVYTEVRDANRQIPDPDFILPDTIVTVPRIGSIGRIFAPNCVTAHTVLSSDTWQSIAQKYNADLEILQTRNPGALSAGRVVYVPNNTAASGAPATSQPTQPIRLTIPAGSTSVSQPGTLAPQSVARYVINATQGQMMTVNVAAPAGSVAMGVYNPAGTAIKAADTTLTWSGVIPQTGDYRIDIASGATTSNTDFTLMVSLTTSTAVTVTPSPTVTPTSTSTTATATSTVPAASGALQQAADVNRGAGNSSPAFLAEYNGALYFQADGGDGTGKELWRFDGTNAGRAADINTGPNGSNPAYLTVYNGALYFAATGADGVGNELWKFDGTNASRVADIWNGAESSSPASLAVLNGVLYFSADGNDGKGYEIWKYDGTNVSRAVDVLDGAGDSVPAYLTVYNGALYFQADGGDGTGYELWKYDGTTASRVADIWVGSGNSNPAHLAVYNNALYFSANANDSAGYELWKYDGTNLTRAADIWVGGDSNPSYLTAYNGVLYFNANGNDGGGQKLWRYDGSSASRVPEPSGITISSPAFLTVHKGALYFQVNGNNGAGVELWRYSST